MCQLLGVTRSGYYGFEKKREKPESDPEKKELKEWVVKLAEASGY
jgi:putative transposase